MAATAVLADSTPREVSARARHAVVGRRSIKKVSARLGQELKLACGAESLREAGRLIAAVDAKQPSGTTG